MFGIVFLWNVSIILVSGFVAGCICKRFKISPLIGYLLIGALIGPGGIDLLGSRMLERAAQVSEQSQLLEDEQQAMLQRLENVEEADFEAAFREEERQLELDAESESTEEELAANSAALDKDFKEGNNDFTKEMLEAHKDSEVVMEGVTEFGVLLLLFAIGIEFTFDKLAATAKYMFVGGALQMGLTIALSIGICMLCGNMTWIGGLALGSVVALSSTALVYRSLGDCGQADTKRAQATVGLLIFQDVALVPLLLILPRILGVGNANEADLWVSNPWVDMALKSSMFCAIVLALKFANMRVFIPKLAELQTNDMVILYAIVVLLGMCVVAILLGLTPALGALAAGIALGENRLTHQIDALVMPFREAFSSMFFISLGMLTDFSYVFHHPLVCIAALVGAVLFKAVCAFVALKACGMDVRGSMAYGLCIAQVGELAFMILALANDAHAINETAYNTMLFVSVASLVLTPNLVKIAMTKFGMKPEEPKLADHADNIPPELRQKIAEATGHVVIVGAGHIGKRIADKIMELGGNVCLIDFNPVNLQPFNQNGVATVAGDGADQNILRMAGIHQADAVFVMVPRDDLSLQVVTSARDMCPTVPIIARSRYSLTTSQLKRAGANRVYCEEEEIANQLVDVLRRFAENAKKESLAAI